MFAAIDYDHDHRFLRMDHVYDAGEDYVHIDLSHKFRERNEVWLVFFLWLIPTLAIRLQQSCGCFPKQLTSSSHRAILYVAASWLMLQCRAWFAGPAYDVVRAVPWEPIVMLWASFLLQTCLTSSTTTTRQQPTAQNRYWHLVWKLVGSALWITTTEENNGGDSRSPLQQEQDWITLMVQTLGSTLTLTGSVANTLIVVLAYDVITYTSLVRDLVIPCSLSLVALMILSAVTTSRHESASGYSNLNPTAESSSKC